MSKIQWTDELKYLLFRVVQEEGAHLTEYGKTDEKWMRVNDKFFSQKETIFLKEVHYQKLNKVEATALNSTFAKIKRPRNDEVTETTPPSTKQKISHFDAALLEVLTSSDEKVPELERELQTKLFNLIKVNSFTIDTIIEKIKISTKKEEVITTLQDIGIEAIISCYCCPGMKFDQKQFKDSMIQFEVPALIALKIYMLLETWRESINSVEFTTP